MKNFLKHNLKFIIPILIIIIIIVVIIVTRLNSKNTFDVYRELEYNYFAMYSTDGLVGVVSKDGELLIEPIYEDVYIPNSERDVFFCFSSYNDYVILNSKGEELFSDYENVTVLQTSELDLDFEKYVLKFEKDGKFGLIDFDGNIILEANYDSIESLEYKPGELLIEKDGKFGVASSNGEIKIKVEYDTITGDEFCVDNENYSYAGYIVGTKTDEGMIYGYLNYEGKLLLDVQFESISRVLNYDETDSYLIVMTNGKKGVYKNDKELISQNYQEILYAESSNVFVVRRNSKYGIFNLLGNEILEVKYVEYSLAGDYISVENDDGTKELYDVNGNKISNLNYTSIQAAGNETSYIAIDENGYYNIIGSGDTISDNYTYVSYAFENYFIFRNEEGFYGLLNFYSGVVIEPEYTFMLLIDGTNAIEAEKEDGTVDIYSNKIEKTVTLADAVIETIDENYTRIYSKTDIKYIDVNGEEIENTAIYGDNEIYAFKENEKWGFKNKSGEVVIGAEYDFVTELNEYGFAGVYKDGKWGVVDSTGNVVADCAYEIETYYIPSFVGQYLLELTDTYHCLELE